MLGEISARGKIARGGLGGIEWLWLTNRARDAILAALMLVFSANIVHAAFIRPSVLAHCVINTAFEPFQLLFGPLLYHYVLSLVHPERKASVRREVVTQSLVFIGITAVFSVPGIFLTTFPIPRKILDSGAWATTLAYLSFYLIRSMRMLHAHQRAVRDEFSALGAIGLSWVRAFFTAFLAIEAFWAVLLVMIVHVHFSMHIGMLSALATSALAYGLGFRALSQETGVRL